MPIPESAAFTDALRHDDLATLRRIPKADLHNHFVLGGSRRYLREKTGADIELLARPLASMSEMHAWNNAHIGARFDSPEGRRTLIEAAFVQAREDGVTLLEIGEDAWGLREYFGGDIDALIDAFQSARAAFAPDTELRLQIGLSRHCPVDALLDWLKPFWTRDAFFSIDLYGDELAQPSERFVPIYRIAEERGLRLKAHIGEWGTAEDVRRGVEALHLHEVQHGLAAAQSPEIVDFLARRRIRLNLTPTSNVLLGRVPCMEAHPIGLLRRAGVDVTIGSDDALMFGSDVSAEYLRLYRAGVLSANELDALRLNGLSCVAR